MLTINRVINLPTVTSGPQLLDLNCIFTVERAKNRVQRSGERALQKNDGAGGRGAGTEWGL